MRLSFVAASGWSSRCAEGSIQTGRVSVQPAAANPPSDLMFEQFDRSSTWILLSAGKMAYYAFFLRPLVFHHFFCDWALHLWRRIVRSELVQFCYFIISWEILDYCLWHSIVCAERFSPLFSTLSCGTFKLVTMFSLPKKQGIMNACPNKNVWIF